MARASRRGDTAHWMDSRRKEYERIDKMCRTKDQKMDAHDLATVLKGMEKDGRRITLALPEDDNKILLHITRRHGMGYDSVTVQVKDDE